MFEEFWKDTKETAKEDGIYSRYAKANKDDKEAQLHDPKEGLVVSAFHELSTYFEGIESAVAVLAREATSQTAEDEENKEEEEEEKQKKAKYEMKRLKNKLAKVQKKQATFGPLSFKNPIFDVTLKRVMEKQMRNWQPIVRKAPSKSKSKSKSSKSGATDSSEPDPSHPESKERAKGKGRAIDPSASETTS